MIIIQEQLDQKLDTNQSEHEHTCKYTADIGGAEGPTAEERAKLEEEERERLLALQEAEEMRKDKHRKMEEEREKMRQGVREKVSSSNRSVDLYRF